MSQEVLKDTIPRLHRVIDHARDQLLVMVSGGVTFEHCRLQYGQTQERLQREGRGRVTASRVSEDEKNWAPTRDALSELMRWGAVEQDKLPSSRAFLDQYREREYRLTKHGCALADAAASTQTRARFVDLVAEALISAHPYFRATLHALVEGPIICPVVEGGDIERGPREYVGTAGWGAWGAELIGPGADPEDVTRAIQTHLVRRFGERPPERPTNKALAEATNDAFIVAGFGARSITADATSIKTLLRWGSELLLFDQSKYIPERPNCNVIWLAAELDNDGDAAVKPRRRVLREHGGQVARALVDAYGQQAAASSSSLSAPYLPIHRVRAEAAFKSGVTRALVDMVLSRLADDEWPDLGVTVLTHIGTGALPDSEPPFLHHGRRRLELTITPI